MEAELLVDFLMSDKERRKNKTKPLSLVTLQVPWKRRADQLVCKTAQAEKSKLACAERMYT